MPSNYETFWENQRFAVVGHTSERGFPQLTYDGLRQLGKTVYPVDPSVKSVLGDRAYADLDALPGPVDAIVLETPKEETAEWVRRAAKHGVKNVWIHQTRDTPEALREGRDNDLNVRHGNCAVMYVRPGPSLHGFHRFLWKRLGRY